MQGYVERAKQEIAAGKWKGQHQMDRYDHVYGIYITESGKRRRMDIIIVPRPSWQFALIGWTGSKQYLRYASA